tara:strand:- start:673 stop:915 length:243 start_codon:yes stop_codon:yes gene_type:complete
VKLGASQCRNYYSCNALISALGIVVGSETKGITIMSKLVQAYITNPTDKNLVRLRKYASKHPFGFMMLTKEETQAIAGKV